MQALHPRKANYGAVASNGEAKAKAERGSGGDGIDDRRGGLGSTRGLKSGGSSSGSESEGAKQARVAR